MIVSPIPKNQTSPVYPPSKEMISESDKAVPDEGNRIENAGGDELNETNETETVLSLNYGLDDTNMSEQISELNLNETHIKGLEGGDIKKKRGQNPSVDESKRKRKRQNECGANLISPFINQL